MTADGAAPDRPQCQAIVWKFGPYRSQGRKRRFEREHEKHECHRPACNGGLCWQHAKLKAAGRYVSTW